MRIIKWLDRNLEEVVLGSLLIAISVIMMLQIVCRFAFGFSLAWPEEAGRFCFIFTTFFSIGFCIKHESDLRVDVLIQMLPEKARFLLQTVLDCIAIAVYGYLLYGAVGVFRAVVKSKQISSALSIPMACIYLISAIGVAMGVIRAVQILFSHIRKGKAVANS